MKINRYINQLPPCGLMAGYREPLCMELGGKAFTCGALTLTFTNEDTLAYCDGDTTQTLCYLCVKLDADAYAVGFTKKDGACCMLAIDGKSTCMLCQAPDGQVSLIGNDAARPCDRFNDTCFDFLFGPYVRYLHAPGAQALRDVTLQGDHIALYIPGEPAALLFVNALSMRAVGFCLSQQQLTPVAGYGGFIPQEDRAEAFAL